MSKNFKPIIIVAGDPKSIFFEIFFKTIRSKKIKSPLILIASLKILNQYMKKLNLKKKIN
jgi:4-hydroxy-L-threonine phosphate dehydrogenase PdxA